MSACASRSTRPGKRRDTVLRATPDRSATRWWVTASQPLSTRSPRTASPTRACVRTTRGVEELGWGGSLVRTVWAVGRADGQHTTASTRRSARLLHLGAARLSSVLGAVRIAAVAVALMGDPPTGAFASLRVGSADGRQPVGQHVRIDQSFTDQCGSEGQVLLPPGKEFGNHPVMRFQAQPPPG